MRLWHLCNPWRKVKQNKNCGETVLESVWASSKGWVKQLWKHLPPGCSFKDRINVLAVWATFSQAFSDLQPQTVAPFFQKRIGRSAKGIHIAGVLDYQANALSNPPVQKGPWPELGPGREEPLQGHRVMCVWPPHTPAPLIPQMGCVSMMPCISPCLHFCEVF